MTFCHIKFQSIPSLILFTLTDNPYFYGFEMSLSNMSTRGMDIVQILLFLYKRSIVCYCGWRRWGWMGGGSQNCSFFLSVINVWPLNGLKLQLIQRLKAVVLQHQASSQIRFNSVENNPQALHPPLMTKPKHMLLSVGT